MRMSLGGFNLRALCAPTCTFSNTFTQTADDYKSSLFYDLINQLKQCVNTRLMFMYRHAHPLLYIAEVEKET